MLRRSSPVLAAACALSLAAHAQDRGRLLGIEPGGDAATSSVELLADRPLSFTTLKLRAPPRVVVDFADTELAGAPHEVVVDDGTVRRVAAAIAGQRTARVVIELAADAEFEVRAQGSRVQVRVPRIAPLVARAEPARPPAPSPMEPSAPAEPAVPPAAAAAAPPTSGVATPEPRPAPPEPAHAPAAPPAVAVATRARPRPSHRRAPPAPRHAITGIGFRPVGAGEIIVRSDRVLEYGVTGESGAVLLHLPGTSIPVPNNRRALDTRFFPGPVTRVVPVAIEGGTDVRIELRGHAEYQLAQSGNVLTVTFSAPR